MRYIFLGTPEFAAIILEELIEAGFIPSVVICNTDRPVGRKKLITPPPTKIIATERSIKVYQPPKLDVEEFKSVIGETDFAVVAAYAKIIPKAILEMPRLGTIGVHPSLLPKHRGASPIQTAILNGDAETGVALYVMDEKVDHGPVLVNKKLEIENSDTYESLHDKLAVLSAELLIETLPGFINGEIKPQPQNETDATFTKKFEADNGFVDLEKDDSVMIWRKVRALNPEPGVWAMKNGKRMKILEVDLVDGKLVFKKIQFEGKKPEKIDVYR
ncbi:methionyl-tRNA formyltransferase [Candidatus Jorgensenbacteria bacterium]|nr:methionyl-tRNA formyltransferase [Candidatus Jorgensenbacteria bacterium]